MLCVVRGRAGPHEYVVCGAGHSQKSPETRWCFIHDGRWKYSWYCPGGVEHLFDLQEDPREEHNLADAAAHAEKKQELRAELEAYLATKDGPYLQDGRLFSTPRPQKTEAERRAAGFPGYMLDTHKADALH